VQAWEQTRFFGFGLCRFTDLLRDLCEAFAIFAVKFFNAKVAKTNRKEREEILDQLPTDVRNPCQKFILTAG